MEVNLSTTGGKMRVLVCGSRHFKDSDFMYEVLKPYLKTENIFINGGARGADLLSETWTIPMGIKNIRYPADWNKHGKAASPIRNKQMLDEGKPDLVVAFMADDSRGTKNMVDQATKAGVEVRVINI